jgi:bifunctional non-homologous end joining protein LigD
VERVAIPFHFGQALNSELVKPRSTTSVRLPDFVEPMKAKLVDSIPKGDWIYEIKFDGYRALALRGGSET